MCIDYLYHASGRQRSIETFTDAYSANDIALHANTPTQAISLLHSLELVARGVGLQVKSDKIEFMFFKQGRSISTLNGKPQKLEDKSTYQGSNVSSTESDVNIHMGKSWTAINRYSIIWKYNL